MNHNRSIVTNYSNQIIRIPVMFLTIVLSCAVWMGGDFSIGSYQMGVCVARAEEKKDAESEDMTHESEYDSDEIQGMKDEDESDGIQGMEVEDESDRIQGIEAEDDSGRTVRIVIDPGHGGENLGGEYEDYTEKELTIVVARAMKEELEKYEGITVFLTRSDDRDLTLKERCEYAKEVDADFLFCLHFNLSEYHTLFGAECWVSAFGANYSKGYEFASIELDMLQEMGLYSRGIKTRLNSRGSDYYGIIRHATEKEIPCVLIEHCYLDQENDQPFCDHDGKLKEFGRLDATAVARYFHLKSEELGADYRGYQNVTVEVPTDVVAPDRTDPDVCMIEVLSQNAENGDVTVKVTAEDYDSGMLYYTYSYDDGETFSELLKWPDRSSDTFSFTINIPPHIVPRIVVNAYNGYDLYTTSNTISLPSMDYKTAEEIEAELTVQKAIESVFREINQSLEAEDAEEENADDDGQAGNTEESDIYLIAVCAICAVLVLGMMIAMALILSGRNRRRRRRRKKSRPEASGGQDI